MSEMGQDQLFERLWNGEATMEEWTATASGGTTQAITDIELVHGLGETDDATFVWLPEKRILI